MADTTKEPHYTRVLRSLGDGVGLQVAVNDGVQGRGRAHRSFRFLRVRVVVPEIGIGIGQGCKRRVSERKIQKERKKKDLIDNK